VAVARPVDDATSPVPYLPTRMDAIDAVEHQRFQSFALGFPVVRQAYQAALKPVRGELPTTESKIAVFGAGHQAVMFVNALGLGDRIAMLVDDDTRKQGHRVPGTAIPIVSSGTLLADRDIGACLLAVSPRVEQRIVDLCAPLQQRGTRFYSIFPGSDMPTLLRAAP
jgi:hypothetical protein